MTVRAKMKCVSKTLLENGAQIKLSAVYGSEGENKDFTTATPSGELTMSISKGAPAAEAFEPGKCYYVDFTEA
jgi:hypothetical protein